MEKTLKELTNKTKDVFNPENLKDTASYKDKIKNDYAWVKNKHDYYESLICTRDKEEVKALFKLFYGKHDVKRYEYLANPFGIENEEVAELEHYNIVSNAIREFVGEEISRIQNVSAVGTSSDLKSKKRDNILNYYKEVARNIILEDIELKLKQQASEKLQQGVNQEQVEQEYQQALVEQTPEEVEKILSKAYKLPEEEAIEHLIKYLIKDNNLVELRNKAWLYAQISGIEVYYFCQRYNKVIPKLIHPLNFYYFKNSESHWIQDSEGCVHDRILSLTQIYEEYGHLLTKTQAEKLEEEPIISGRLGLDSIEYLSALAMHARTKENLILIEGDAVTNNYTTDGLSTYYRVTHTAFKTLKKIKVIESTITGNKEELIVDETYTLDPYYDTLIKELSIPEWWECIKIGTDLYIGMGPTENQYRSLEDPYLCYGPFIGIEYSLPSSPFKSTLARGEKWQFLYDVIMHRLKSSISTNYGNVLIGLINQIPSDKGWTTSKWMHHLLTKKIGLINPTAENSLGSDPQYWRSLNLTNADDIANNLRLLELIEEKCYKSMGTNANRLGSAAQYETVTNNQRNIIQASNITEYDFYLHSKLFEQLCTVLVEKTKTLWSENPPITLSYINDDLQAQAFVFNPSNLSLSEIGIFLSNANDDFRTIAELKQLIQAMIQNSNGDFRYVTEMLTTKSTAKLKRLMNQQVEEQNKRLEAQQKHETELQQKQLEAAKAEKAAEREFQASEKEKDRQNKLQEAVIRAMSWADDTDINKDSIPDVIQLQKFGLDVTKFQHDVSIKEREMTLRERELVENNQSEERDRFIELEKLKIQKEKLKNDAKKLAQTKNNKT